MKKIYLLKLTIIFLTFCSGRQVLFSQVTITGTVYDITKKTPFQSVSVLTTSSRGTITDALGHYTITAKDTDSIYFSYLNKPTPKYPVASIINPSSFDVSIMQKINVLPSVFVRPPNYKLDSMENRRDYARIFNYQKPGLRTTTAAMPGGVGASLDLDELINMFKFRKNRRTLGFQRRLLQEEQDKYINHRYTKNLVRKLTSLTTPTMEDFMKEYRPTYEMLQQMNELELGLFIEETYKYYSRTKNN